MATTGAVLDITGEIKETYPTGTFPDAVNKVASFRRALRKVDLKMKDGTAVFPLNGDAAWNVGIVEDNAAFPTPVDPLRIKGTVKPETWAVSMQLGLKSIHTLGSEKGSFHSGGIVSDRVESSIADLGKFINLVYAGTNRCRLGVVDTEPAANQLQLTKRTGVVNVQNKMRIDVYDGFTSGAVRDSLSNRTVSARVKSTRSFTYSGADQTPVAGDHVFPVNTYDKTVYTLDDIVDDGTVVDSIFAQSRTTYPHLKALVVGNGGVLRNPSEQLFLECIYQAQEETGKSITKALANRGQIMKTAEFTSADRRYPGVTAGGQDYSVGVGKITIFAAGVNCELEYECNAMPRKIYFLAWDTFGLYEAMAADWIDEGDGRMHLIPTDGGHKAGILGYAGSIENLINTMPKANVRCDDLKDPLVGDV
jgi:hypothetical protein